MLRPRRLAAIAGITAAVGCAPERPPLTSPAAGGPAWTAWTSEHLVLETDLPAEEAVERVAAFERMHEAVAAVTGIQVPPKGPRVEVVLFARKADFMSFVDKTHDIAGYFTPRAPGDLEPQPLMVIYEEELPDEIRMKFQHEIAHRLLHTRFPLLDRWMDEGLAQYYSTVQVRPDGLVVGDAIGLDFWNRTYSGYTWVGQMQQLNLPIALAPRPSAVVTSGDGFYAAASKAGGSATATDRLEQAENYAVAWRLVHYLLDEAPPRDRARFAACLAALERGERDAFRTRFATEMPRIDRDFESYLARPTGRSVVRRGLATSRAPSVRRLSEVDVHLLWSRLFSPDDDRAGAEAAVALRLAPRDGEPHFRRAAIMMQEHLDVAARQEIVIARAISPSDPRYIYAEILLDERQREGISPGLIDELARSAVSAAELERAASYVGRRSLADGLLLAARAVATDPLCWRCQVTRANLLAKGGAYDDALAALDRAAAIMPEQDSAAALLPTRRRILEDKARAEH